MPIYDYVCHHCGHRFEVIHGLHADGPTTCPVCHGGPVRKAVVATAFHFKGSGWAKKDRGASAARSSTPAESVDAPKTGGDGSTEAPKSPKTASSEAGSTTTPAPSATPPAD